VGVVHEGRVYMACDSQISVGGNKNISREEENNKVWHHSGKENLVIGSCGNVREVNLAKNSAKLFSELDMVKNEINASTLTNSFVKNLFEVLIENKAIKDEPPYRMGNEYLVGFQGSLYQIGVDGSVIRISNYTAIGSGRYEALGVLAKKESKNIEEILIDAIAAAIDNDLYCDYPILMTNTAIKTMKIIEKAGS
jgi:ATP-dependent protease HslVU (ClpYQ) peptidase subunit